LSTTKVMITVFQAWRLAAAHGNSDTPHAVVRSTGSGRVYVLFHDAGATCPGLAALA
jgi:hypothetical protein